MMKISVAARKSTLSQIQVKEVLEEIRCFHPQIQFESLLMATVGDLDVKTSLRDLEKTNFFTQEIDQALINGKARVGIHSAKDLPEPLPIGLTVAAFTKGKSCRDALVLREKSDFNHLPKRPIIGTSTRRRETAILKICPEAQLKDLRGDIQNRLEQLFSGNFDGIVIAEAAILRLNLRDLNYVILSGETAPMQGKLAVVVRDDDQEMIDIFQAIHYLDRGEIIA